METKRTVVPAAEEILGLYFPVLDHGFVSLIDYMGGDSDVVDAARVSYAAGTEHKSSERDLLRYLLRQHHTSPFEMCEMKFHVCLPIFVARQLVRHRTASLNEVSLRYSLPAMQFYVPREEDMGQQSKKNRQGRGVPLSPGDAAQYQSRWRELQSESVELYECMTSPDVDLARELARMHLPVSIYTRWIWKLDLNNLMHFLTLRCDSHAQWEIQQYANLKAAMVKRVAPLSFQAWLDYEFQSHTFSRMEMQMLRRLIGTSNTSPGDGETYTPTAVQVMYGEISKSHADALSLSGREWQDFMAAFNRVTQPDRFESMFDAPQFTIDPADGLPAAWYEAATKKFLPKGA